ncbi:CsbD family protein [Rivibacter subsaxonicus]|uniref:Uncharacterized protein YjbJ (UPF0337 family) n=1 Tax=Rivibacter subsaxonicus TaxID=457575 RepID=A0A4Q7VWZ2_9BURK|nr:CsbD family protein [Rivibacter subsaxonicus]RZU01261.1 uncharacterized protein YjbJ (UPF0337 family) [Rivibacter subsaxonicus]
MNWDRIEGNWKQLTGKVQEQWGKLTNDDLDVIAGKREQIVGKIQQRYGVAKDVAEKQVDAFFTPLANGKDQPEIVRSEDIRRFG